MSDIDVIEVYPVELTSTNSTRPEKFDDIIIFPFKRRGGEL